MKKTLLLLLGLATLFFASCSDDDEKSVPKNVNEEELITNFVLTLTEEGGTDQVIFTATSDQGLEDGAVNVVQSAPLKANMVYFGVITLSNTDENVTEEIQDEDDEHQFFFAPTDGISVFYTDMDEDGNPVGLEITISTSQIVAPASLNVKLVHEPNKNTDSAKAGILDESVGGKTELNVDLNITDIDENIAI